MSEDLDFNEEEEQAAPAEAEPDRVKLKRLHLADGQGWVDFGDVYALNGNQVQKLRTSAEGAREDGNASNAVLARCAQLFVSSWEIAYIRNAPLPKVDVKVLGRLRGIDLVAIERHMQPAMALYLDLPSSRRDEDGSP
jgi:hypothetical protein